MSDSLVKAINGRGTIRCLVAEATQLVQTAKETQKVWSSASVALGRVLIGTLFLGANLKGNDRVSVKIKGSGQGGMIVAEANRNGVVKGYIQNPQVDLKYNATELPAVKETVGSVGSLQVVKEMGLKTPYVSEVPLVSGEIGEDFTYYMTVSEQIPSAFGLNVLLNEEEQVKVAGGFLVQVLPGASEEEIQRVEACVQAMPAISNLLEQGGVTAVLKEIFRGETYRVLEEQRIRFSCDCSKERFSSGLISLGQEELRKIIEEDHQAEVVCQFCGKKFQYTAEELELLESRARR